MNLEQPRAVVYSVPKPAQDCALTKDGSVTITDRTRTHRSTNMDVFANIP